MNVMLAHNLLGRLAGLVCALWVALAISFAAAHSHPHEAADVSSADCSVCIVTVDLDDINAPTSDVKLPVHAFEFVPIKPRLGEANAGSITANARGPPVA